MKKLTITLIFTVLLILTVGCNKRTSLEGMLKDIQDAESITVTTIVLLGHWEDDRFIEVDVFNSLVKKDNDKSYLSFSDVEIYSYFEDNQMYIIYVQNEEYSIETGEPLDNDEDSMLGLIKSLKASWFEYKDGVYVLKPEYYHEVIEEEAIEEIRSFEITIKGSTLTIVMESNLGGEGVIYEVRISSINSTTIELPNVEEGEQP